VKDLSSIEAVIFDFGGVLCAHPSESQFAEIARLLEAEPAEFTRAFWQHRVPYDAGLDETEYWSTVVDELGLSWDVELLPHLLKHEVGLWTQYDARLLNFAGHLQTRGYSTGVLSNLPRPLGEALRNSPGFLDSFDHHTFSYELGIVKPDTRIYRHSLAGLGVGAERALFLDDRPENVAGAREAGLHAELYIDWEDLAETIAPRYGLPLPAVARRQ
jgi:putative hydrolase of the HAD superfamily